MTPGLAGTSIDSEVEVNLTGGVPKPVKKTFAQQISSAEMSQRLKGSAVTGVNVPGGPAAAARRAEETASEEQASGSAPAGRPGAIDAFKAMARDLNA
jgi:hypothetical protein